MEITTKKNFFEKMERNERVTHILLLFNSFPLRMLGGPSMGGLLFPLVYNSLVVSEST